MRRKLTDIAKGETIVSNGNLFRVRDINDAAKAHDVPVRDICVMDLKVIKTQAFRGTGVCSENCRKDRDNDHMPARTTA